MPYVIYCTRGVVELPDTARGDETVAPSRINRVRCDCAYINGLLIVAWTHQAVCCMTKSVSESTVVLSI